MIIGSNTPKENAAGPALSHPSLEFGVEGIRVKKSVGKHTENGRNGDCPTQRLIFQLATNLAIYLFLA